MPEPVPKKAMKVKCVRLLDAFGREVASSPWLTLGRIYHVVTVEIDAAGKRRYGLVTSEKAGEWPSMGEHQAECFELVSATVPSNWRSKIDANGTISIAPGAWQESGFFEAFYDHDLATYPIFEREYNLILNEDP